MAEINDLDVVDANNTARFAENQFPSTVNDGARGLEGIIARWNEDTNGSIASTGASNAYALAAKQTLTAYYDGQRFSFDANHANTGAATLDVDGIGAKTIKKHNDQDLASGDIEAGQKVDVVYDGTNFQLQSPVANAPGDLKTSDIGNTVQAYDADTAKTDVAQEYTATQNFNGTTLTDGATINWDASANQVATVTLGGNRTMAAPTNLKDGATYILIVKQDATGSRTITWNSVFKWPGGTAPTLTTTATTGFDVISFYSDGTNLYGSALLDFQ